MTTQSFIARSALVALLVVTPTFRPTLVSASSWSSLDSPTSDTLYSVESYGDTVVAVGEGGVVAYSEDNGETWDDGDSNTSYDLYAVSMGNADDGAAVGESGTIVYTENSGADWEDADIDFASSSHESYELRAIDMTSSTVGFAVGENGLILHTENGGQDWEEIDTPSTAHHFNSVFAYSSSKLWVAGEDGALYYSDDGGDSWDSQSSGTTENLVTITFYGSSDGWASGDNRIFLRTENGGTTWTKTTVNELDSDETINDISFRSSDDGLMIGQDGFMLETDDGGQNWDSVSLPSDEYFIDLQYVSDGERWAVGSEGVIYGYDVSSSDDDDEPSAPDDFDVEGTNSSVSDTTPTFTWDAPSDDDIDYYEFKMDSGSYKDIDNVTSYTYSSTLSSGSHTAYVRAVDESGNEGSSASLSFTIDTDSDDDDDAPGKPSGFDVEGSNSDVTDTTPLFTWSAPDDDDIDYYEFKMDSGSYKDVGDDEDYTYSTTLSNGSHTAYVRAVDESGNEGTAASLSFTVDADSNDDDAPTVGKISPTTAVKDTTVTLSADISDDGDIDDCDLYLDGEYEKNMTLKTDYTYTTYKFTSTGSHTAYVRCTDDDDNKTSGSSVTIVVSSGTSDADSGDIIKIGCEGDVYVNDPCTAVYYYGADGYRHAFPNESVYKSWYTNYNNLVVLSEDAMSDIPLGGNVTYRPGTYLIKFSTNTVYAISYGGVLRPIANAEIAEAIYDEDWVGDIVIVGDVFYGNYTIGDIIDSSNDYSKSAVKSASDSIDDVL